MISFVIPAYDEEPMIPGTLAAIDEAARAVGEPYEIIVVDDGSADRTAEVAARHGARVVRIRRRHIAAARNAGAREARGDRFVFVDADTKIDARLLRSALGAMRAGAVGGGAPIRMDGRLPRYYFLLEPLFLGMQRVAGFAGGCFLFCTRPAFESAGGFDERMFGAEEIGLSMALKRQGRFVLLREPVRTSGRKLRLHSGREILRTAGFLLSRGPRAVASRDGLEMWYGPRRHDPELERGEAASG